MERLLQYWDDLDDLIGAFALYKERMRRLALFSLYTLFIGSLQLGGIILAIYKPPLAMAAATILLVTLLYRSATNPHTPSILA
ncbi:MAG: hypothetical protein KJO82_11260 [Gammaproteobacteria bacterium]|nr:hypothetical protein [Gammaproteobacteria bacterium]